MQTQDVPVKIVGSSDFGRYPMVNAEHTYNMYTSDDWLISFAGYKPAVDVIPGSSTKGRGVFRSARGNFLIVVIGPTVYRINDVDQTPIFLFDLTSSSGAVFMDENLASQIAIVGGGQCWIYNYEAGLFAQASLDANLVPNYVTYQNTYFIFGNRNQTNVGSLAYVYTASTGTALVFVTVIALQTKPDFAVAAIRIPGAGNNLLVFGLTVAEIWSDIGGSQVYQRNSSVNIDYGTVSISTIAANEEMICWLAVNEASSPILLTMRGGRAEAINTSGIAFLLDSIRHPEQSTAFFYRQDGHLFYVLTFYNAEDNVTINYDFNEKKFNHVTDWNANYFPAAQVAYFNGQSYFVSLNDATLYEIGSDINYYKIGDKLYEIPRIRITDTYRNPTFDTFTIQKFGFTLENGIEQSLSFSDEQPRIDVSLSKDGGFTFGNAVPYLMHPTAYSRCRPRFYQLGRANQITVQLRFWGFDRFVINNGYLTVNQ